MSDYDIIRELGKGAFGTVYLIRHKSENEVYALKAIELKDASEKDRNDAEKEAKLMSELDHQHLVRYVASYFNRSTFCIFTEYCEGGDLAHFLGDTTGSLPETLIVCWIQQATSALEHLHGKNILHRDLKPANIYLTGSGNIKLGDLGIARVLDKGVDMALTVTGTPFYMSPEVFGMEGYDHKTDIWSLGCIAYELATKVQAFDGMNLPCLIIKIKRGKVPLIPDCYSSTLQLLVKSMMTKDPDERPSAADLLKLSPIKEFRARPHCPKDTMSQSNFTTKWGTHESSVHIDRMLTKDSSPPTTRGVSEIDIRIPVDSLILHRERLKRDQDTWSSRVKGHDMYSKIKAPKGKDKVKSKVGVKDPDATLKWSCEKTRHADGWSTITDTMKTLCLDPSGSTSSGSFCGSSGHKGERTRLVVEQTKDLHRMCVESLGEDVLEKADSLLDSEMEIDVYSTHLMKLLGKDKFRELGETVMYLKLFESTLK